MTARLATLCGAAVYAVCALWCVVAWGAVAYISYVLAS